MVDSDFLGPPDPYTTRARRNSVSRRRSIFWWCWILAAVALSFGVYQFIHAANLGYKDVGPGNAFGAHYSPGRRGPGTYYVHVHVDSQHRNTDDTVSGPTSLYELVLNDPSPVPVQQVEVDKFTNEVSRVAYNGRWLNVTGRQTKATLIIAGTIAMLIALASLAWNVYDLSRRRRAGSRSLAGRELRVSPRARA